MSAVFTYDPISECEGWALDPIRPDFMSGQWHCQLNDFDEGIWSIKASGPLFEKSDY